MKRSTLSELTRLVGPYPYNPYLIFLFFFALFFSRLTPVIVTQPIGPDRWLAAIVMLILSVFPSSLFALCAYLFERYRPWSPNNLFAYICEVASAQSLSFLCAPLMGVILRRIYKVDFQAPLTLTPGFFIGALMLALIALSLMHRAERKIAGRLVLADQLVSKLKHDRQDLVRADEEVRDQTARFLHDRVQSDLMVVSMKLRSINGKSSAEINEVIDRAISRLELTRTSDLKNLVQILAPNFVAGGLGSAVANLLEQYKSSMEVAVSIDETTEKLKPNDLLGIFRIIEQALLNSLVHGPAKKVQIHVATTESGYTQLNVADDGPGVDIKLVSSGVGTAVIDSWVSILNGDKRIETNPGNGYRLRVSFQR